ncbi:hypothetical protein BD413DRAFT_615859 [Trametes elegans]|nr:hypothetical protein BD413DRAFT_615859 [Trametes elegans]
MPSPLVLIHAHNNIAPGQLGSPIDHPVSSDISTLHDGAPASPLHTASLKTPTTPHPPSPHAHPRLTPLFTPVLNMHRPRPAPEWTGGHGHPNVIALLNMQSPPNTACSPKSVTTPTLPRLPDQVSHGAGAFTSADVVGVAAAAREEVPFAEAARVWALMPMDTSPVEETASERQHDPFSEDEGRGSGSAVDDSFAQGRA